MMKTQNSNSGFTLYIAITIVSVLMIIAGSLVNLAVKQLITTHTISESQQAFYAADTGLECGLYWDVKNSGESAFTGGGLISCNKNAQNPNNEWPIGANSGASINTFQITFNPSNSCAEVTVTKTPTGPDAYATKIESKGYNTCDLSSQRRVERAVKATY